MTSCIVTEDHRTKVSIDPWRGSDSLQLCVRAGKAGRVLEESTAPGHLKVVLDYPFNRTVTAVLPASVLNIN